MEPPHEKGFTLLHANPPDSYAIYDMNKAEILEKVHHMVEREKEAEQKHGEGHADTHAEHMLHEELEHVLLRSTKIKAIIQAARKPPEQLGLEHRPYVWQEGKIHQRHEDDTIRYLLFKRVFASSIL